MRRPVETTTGAASRPNGNLVVQPTKVPPWFNVLGTRVSAVTMDEALGFLEAAITKGTKHHVCVCSVNMVMVARNDPDLRQALDTASLVTPDGYFLTRIGRRRFREAVGRVRGTDLMRSFSALAATKGYRAFLIGGDPGVPERLSATLQKAHPGLRIVGAYSPPFRPPTDKEEEALLKEINRLRPDIVWVGLGCPKQERWMLRNRARLDAPVLVGVGAAFDFIAGTKREAPVWVRRAGLEWLWRFLHEPRRLWRRVIIEGPLFVALLLAEAVTRTNTSAQPRREPAPTVPPQRPE